MRRIRESRNCQRARNAVLTSARHAFQAKKKANPKVGLFFIAVFFLEVDVNSEADLPERTLLTEIVDVTITEARVHELPVVIDKTADDLL